MTSAKPPDPGIDFDAMTPSRSVAPDAPPVSAARRDDSSAARRPSVRSRPAPSGGSTRRDTPAAAHWLLMASFIVALAWSGGAAAYVLGFYGVSTVTGGGPERVLGFAFIVLGPALILVTLGVVTSEFLRLASVAQSIDVATRRLAAPVDHAQGDARRLADIIAQEVERVSRSAEGALGQLGAMEEVLRHHAESVNAASGGAREEVDKLIEDLRSQRDTLGGMTQSLGTEAERISQSIDRQAEMVSAAADLAAAHAEEGREMLERGAERLQSSASEAQQSGEKAAFAISEQMRDMEALVSALDERAARLENLAKSQQDNLRIAQSTAHELNLAAEAGVTAMQAAVDSAVDQARRLSDMTEQEMRAISSKSAEDIERVRAAADAARLSAENSGRALEASSARLMERIEQLNDATVHMSHQLDEAAQSRVQPLPHPGDRRFEADYGERGGFPRSERYEADARLPARREPRTRRYSDDGYDARERPRSAPPRERERDADPFAPRDFIDDPITRPGSDPRQERRASRDEFNAGVNGRGGYDDGYADDGDGFGGYGHADADPAGRRHDNLPTASTLRPMPDADGDEAGWRWRDLLRSIDEGGSGAPARGGGGGGAGADAVVSALRRAGVDPARALDPDMTARIARARRRAGAGEARALVLDGAMSDVRRTASALSADPTLRGRAEGFLDEHARMVRRAVDQNDVAGLSALLDTDPGRAYLLIDAALADV